MKRKSPEHRIAFTDHEWYRLLRRAVPMMDQGASAYEAVKIAQNLELETDHRRRVSSILNKHSPFYDFLERFRNGWRPHASSRVSDLPVEIVESRFTKGIVKWTDREYALLAFAVKWMRDHGDTRPMSRLYWEAQQIVFEPDRCRGISSLQAGSTKLGELHERGLRDGWQIDKERRVQILIELGDEETLKALVGKKAPEPERAPALAVVAATPPAPEVPVTTAQEAAPPVVSEPEPIIAAPSTSPPSATAPTRSVLSERIAGVMGRAVEEMLAIHEDHLSQQFSAHIDAMSHTFAEKFFAQVTPQLVKSLALSLSGAMRAQVKDILADELGGPVGEPPAPKEAPPSPPPAAPRVTIHRAPRRIAAEHAEPRVKVDVVGLLGGMLTEVKRSVGDSLDIRYIAADDVGSWTPREHVVMLTRFVSHDAQEKIKAKRANLYFANGGATSVLEHLAQLKARLDPRVH